MRNNFLKAVSILLTFFIILSCVNVCYAKTNDVTVDITSEHTSSANHISYIMSIDGNGGDNTLCTSETLRLSEPVIQLQLINRYASQLRGFRASIVDDIFESNQLFNFKNSITSSVFIHENVANTTEPVTNYIHQSDGKKR